jgi:Arc/MetJ-type ribon-helix-helix transcriptional regulator
VARRNIYLTDPLDRRVRDAIQAGKLDASDVCQRALGAALNSQPPAQAAAPVEQHQAEPAARLAGRLDTIERHLQRLTTAAAVVLLAIAALIMAYSVPKLASI